MESIGTDSLYSRVLETITERRSRGFSLRMAPMIDIIFLLLIFFLVAAKWRPEENFLPFQLPTATAAEQLVGRPEPLVVYIFATETGCSVQIARQHAVEIESASIDENLAALMEQMQSSLTSQKRYASDPVEIVCQGQVKWQYLAKIYNLFFGAGLTDITFELTEQPDNGKFE